MSTLLISVLILIYTAHSLFAKLYSANYPGEQAQSSPVYSVWYGLIVATATLAISAFTPAISLTTVIFGLFNAFALFGYNTSLICASERGPYSFVVIISLYGGILVPLASSAVFFDGKLNLLQWIAVIIVLVSFIFLNYEGKGKHLRDSVKPGYFAFCALLFISNGVYGSILSAQQSIMNGTENNGLTVVTYYTACIISLTVLFLRRGKRAFGDLKLNVKSGACLLVCSSAVTAGIIILMNCLSMMNAGALYTAENGGVLLLSVIVSAILFKEKLTPMKIIGVVLALAGVVMLSIP